LQDSNLHIRGLTRNIQPDEVTLIKRHPIFLSFLFWKSLPPTPLQKRGEQIILKEQNAAWDIVGRVGAGIEPDSLAGFTTALFLPYCDNEVTHTYGILFSFKLTALS